MIQFVGHFETKFGDFFSCNSVRDKKNVLINCLQSLFSGMTEEQRAENVTFFSGRQFGAKSIKACKDRS